MIKKRSRVLLLRVSLVGAINRKIIIMDESGTTMRRVVMQGIKAGPRIILTCSLGRRGSKQSKVRKVAVRMRKWLIWTMTMVRLLLS
jgi:hypothetical protein